MIVRSVSPRWNTYGISSVISIPSSILLKIHVSVKHVAGTMVIEGSVMIYFDVSIRRLKSNIPLMKGLADIEPLSGQIISYTNEPVSAVTKGS